MASVQTIVSQMRSNPRNIRFADLNRVCKQYFGNPRKSGSHTIYATPWPGDPRVNVQNQRGMAKAYQVRHVLKAIDKLGE